MFLLGKFLKADNHTSSQDGACSVAIKELSGRITCMPQLVGEGIAEGSSPNLYCLSDTSHSTKKSKVSSTLSWMMLEKCDNDKFDDIHDAFDYLVDVIA